MSPKKATSNKKTMPKKISPAKKTSKKMPATKKPAPKKAALKKKVESKKTAKVGKIVAKENAQGKKMAISKSSEERAARVSRRGLAKEAPAAKEPQRKRARLDGSSDLVDLLTTSAGVLDIFAASGRRPLPREAVLAMGGGGASEVVVEDTFNMENTFGMEDTYELDRLIGASPASASVLDIIAAAASASRTLPKEASAEDREAVGEVALESSEEAFGEASTSKAAFFEKIAANIAGAEDPSDDGLPIANHLCEGSLMDQTPSASFLGNNQVSQVAQDGISSTRPRKAYLSPALIWLEEEGLPTAEMEAKDLMKALGGA